MKTHMIRMGLKDLKIFRIIVGQISIYMMYNFCWLQSSS